MYAWNWEPQLIIGLLGQLAAYFLCVVGPLRRFFPDAEPWRASQIQLFVLGWLALVIALVTPIDTLGLYSLTMHMVQHLIVTLVVPPLLLAGTPRWLFRPLLRMPIVRDLLPAVTNPVATFLIFNAVFALWHVPAYYNAALLDERVHILEHATFFLTATLSWWPLFSPLEELPPAHPLAQSVYLFFMAIPSTVLGAIITLSGANLYPHYASVAQPFGLTTADDQQLGGLIMWFVGSLFYFFVMMVIFIRWMNSDDRTRGPRAYA